jgi:endonuclease/exonuclease/phosphatase family metal-dependent hydrolase
MSDCVILNWNVEWVPTRSQRFRRVQEVLSETKPDIIVLMEATPNVLPKHGSIVTSDADYGYSPTDRTRRKVLLWSRNSWSVVDNVGSPLMPGGRFVAGTTETQVGLLRIVGVCIPWRDAHVRTGQKDRKPWEDHCRYLDGLKRYLECITNVRTLVVGDFNQRVPASNAPRAVATKLLDAFSGWEISTAGLQSAGGDALIDHVAMRPGSAKPLMTVIERMTERGEKRSDHHGVIVRLSLGR